MCDFVLPSLGEEASEYLAEKNLLLRHGTSLSLMSLVGTALNESEEFAEIDVSADWEKWSTRRPDFSLYYAALLDPARDGADAVQCVLRAVLDGVPSPSPPHRPRLIIDYVTTRPVARGRGLASLLVDFVVETSRACGALANRNTTCSSRRAILRLRMRSLDGLKRPCVYGKRFTLAI